MKQITNDSLIQFTPDEFLYLKSVFAIKKAGIDCFTSEKDWFFGDLYGVMVFSEAFTKGKYTL